MTTSTHSHCFQQHSLVMGFVWLASQKTNAITGDQITWFRQLSDNRDAPGISLTALVWFVTTVHLVLSINGDKGLELPGKRDKLWIRAYVFWGKDNSILGFPFHFNFAWFFLSPIFPRISLYSLQISSNYNSKNVTDSLFLLTRSAFIFGFLKKILGEIQ